MQEYFPPPHSFRPPLVLLRLRQLEMIDGYASRVEQSSLLIILSTFTSADSCGRDSDWEEESISRPRKVAPYYSRRSKTKKRGFLIIWPNKTVESRIIVFSPPDCHVSSRIRLPQSCSLRKTIFSQQKCFFMTGTCWNISPDQYLQSWPGDMCRSPDLFYLLSRSIAH